MGPALGSVGDDGGGGGEAGWAAPSALVERIGRATVVVNPR